MILTSNSPAFLKLVMDQRVDRDTFAVCGRDNQRSFRIVHIVDGNRFEALNIVFNLCNSSLSFEQRNGSENFFL
ncbi:hypothetical protein D3C83_156280 [compost metagenome]